MKESSSTTLTKGSQIALPASARPALGVKPRDRIFVTIEGDRILLSVPRYPAVSSLVGAAGCLDTPLSMTQMREIAYRGRFARRTAEADD